MARHSRGELLQYLSHPQPNTFTFPPWTYIWKVSFPANSKFASYHKSFPPWKFCRIQYIYTSSSFIISITGMCMDIHIVYTRSVKVLAFLVVFCRWIVIHNSISTTILVTSYCGILQVDPFTVIHNSAATKVMCMWIFSQCKDFFSNLTL